MFTGVCLWESCELPSQRSSFLHLLGLPSSSQSRRPFLRPRHRQRRPHRRIRRPSCQFWARTKNITGIGGAKTCLAHSESSAQLDIMAKPLLVAPLHGVDPTPPRCYSQLLPETSYRPRRRRSHRPSKPSSSTVGPSSGLLSLLATIASATSANASPAPPQFLCPSIGTRDIVDERPLAKKRASSSSSPSTVNDTNKWGSKRQLPHKYERGSDGVWRRVDSYTLYGSTVPSGCTSPVSIYAFQNDL